jgi:DNA-directed RNA polymerase specialized sigma24 family protein
MPEGPSVPKSAASSRALQHEIWSKILCMKPEYREVLMIVLLDMEHGRKLNTTEIAEALGTDQSELYRRLGKALSMLGEALKQSSIVRDWMEQLDADTGVPQDPIVARLLKRASMSSSEKLSTEL